MKYWIQKYATHIVAVSEDALTRGWSADWHRDPRCRVIYNGLDSTTHNQSECRQSLWQELDLKADERVCINVGRMAPQQKNHERLIEIFADISHRVSPVCLLLVGFHPPEYREKLQQIAHGCGCTGRLIFLGVRSDVNRLLTAADLMIFPTFYEGLPGVVLEACAVGLPVLASDIPPVAEIARHLSGIHQLSLSLPTATWGATALELLQNQRERSAVEVALEFAHSPFCLETALGEVEQLYKCSADNAKGAPIAVRRSTTDL